MKAILHIPTRRLFGIEMLGLYVALCCTLLLVLLWGGIYEDATYLQLQRVQALTSGPFQLFSVEDPYDLLLAWGSWVGLPLSTFALILSLVGWFLALGSWFFVGRSLNSPLFAILAIVFLLLHPLQPLALGSGVSLGWGLLSLAAWLALQKRVGWVLLTLGFAGLSEPSVLLLGIPLLVVSWLWQRGRLPRLSDWIIILVVWGGLIVGSVALFSSWISSFALRVLLLAVVDVLAAAVGAYLLPDLRRLLEHPGLEKRTSISVAALVMIVLLILLQGRMLLQAWRVRPVGRLAAYRALSTYLRDRVAPADVVAAPYPGMLGYLYGHPILPLSADADMAQILSLLDAQRPDYCLGLNSITWEAVRAQPWFVEHYRALHEEVTVYDSASPWVLYESVPSPFDFADCDSIDATFGSSVEESVTLLEYCSSGERIAPDEPLYVTLYWTAGNALHSLGQLHLTLQLVDQETGHVWAQLENPEPGNLPMRFWNADRSVRDRYTVTLPEDAIQGDYQLELTLRRDKGGVVSFLGGDKGPFTLAMLSYPPTVTIAPPRSDVSTDMQFGGAIALVGYDTPSWISPGNPFQVAFYWHALNVPTSDIKVFVHLFDSAGTLVAQSDSKPADWSYPTTAWKAGEYIRDEHILTVDPQTSRGELCLSVGMYDAESGERLSIRGEDGTEILEGRAMLSCLPVR